MPGLVAVTGISGHLGRALARLLHTETLLVGIDRRPFPERPKDLVHYEVDLRKRKLDEVFRRHPLEAVIHLGLRHDPRTPFSETHSFNILGTHKLFELCVQHGVKKVVVLSSANVYGPAPDNSNFLTEEAPLMAADRYSGVRDLIELDMYAQSFLWKHPEIETVVLRPVHIVGPTIANGPSKFLRLERPITVLGFDPMIQLVHVDDVCRALALALRPGARGVYNVVGPGEVPLSTILRELGRRPIPVPHLVVRALVARAFEARLTDFPPEQVDHLQYLCAVDGSRAVRDLGYAPRRSLRETIRSVLAS
ncbi:MAG TPA: SDR family oxidoreductase [Anaeromyxobacteraceae bacterium]|nr:SDR family oxidoreductase [Anaeromyxobacteraceae bacterium]